MWIHLQARLRAPDEPASSRACRAAPGPVQVSDAVIPSERSAPCHPERAERVEGSAPRLDASTATVFHAEFAEVRGVRGVLVREPSATAEVRPRIGAQGFWARSPRRGAEPRRTALRVEISSPRRGPLHPRPQRTTFWGRHSTGSGAGSFPVLRELRGPRRWWRPRRTPPRTPREPRGGAMPERRAGADPSTPRCALRSG